VTVLKLGIFHEKRSRIAPGGNTVAHLTASRSVFPREGGRLVQAPKIRDGQEFFFAPVGGGAGRGKDGGAALVIGAGPRRGTEGALRLAIPSK